MAEQCGDHHTADGTGGLPSIAREAAVVASPVLGRSLLFFIGRVDNDASGAECDRTPSIRVPFAGGLSAVVGVSSLDYVRYLRPDVPTALVGADLSHPRR